VTASEQVAQQHYAQQVAIASGVAGTVGGFWSQLDLADLARSWASGIGARIVALVTGGQLLAARQADPYLARALAAQGVPGGTDTRVIPAALAGIASDGRDLASLLFEPVITVKQQIGQGIAPPVAKAAGAVQLDMIVRTQIADAGRVADGVGITARPQVTGYVRLLVPPSCARCVILAGRRYAWNDGFERHPRCDCRHIPAAEDTGDDLRTDPQAYFDSLTPAEQDKAFTKAGAEAIRDGADIAQVVNARRGMYTAGGRAFTTESTTRRGRRKGARLMPEQIYREAAGDRAEAVRLLQAHGYLTGAANLRPGPAPTFERTRSARAVLRDTVADARAAERAGTLRWDKLYGGQSAATRVAILPDGRRLVHKAGASWEDPEDARQYADAEHLAALVGQTLDVATPAVQKDGLTAVWMEWAPGDTIGAMEDQGRLDEWRRLLDSRAGRLVGLLDALIGNADRNPGNLIVGPDGRLRPIDHGFAWGYEAGPDQLGGLFRDRPLQFYVRRGEPVNEWIANPLTGGDVAEVRRRLELLRPQFDRLGRADWLTKSLDALDQLARHATGTEPLLGNPAPGDTG
jgi:hypothetical protein